MSDTTNNVMTVCEYALKREKIINYTRLITETIAKRYNKLIDWIKVFTAIKCIDKTLNERKDRMDKGSIIERSISDYSEEKVITWIDGVGKDLYDNEFKLYIEVKYEENCLYTLKRKDPKKFISKD